MSKIIMLTQAYNAEKTLQLSVNSVLRQTYDDFIYYIIDNASTDKTRALISNYAQTESRIVPIYLDKNHYANFIPIVAKIAAEHDDGFLAMLDADDEYTPDFLEKMLAFSEMNSLDVAMCGSDFIDEQTKKLLSKRLLDADLILDGEKFSSCFGESHQFMRTVWCKLYSVPLLKRCSFEDLPDVSYGADTVFNLEVFRNCERAGILAKSLHKYYISSKSMSYKFDNRRIDSDRILDNNTRQLLLDKCGAITQQNDYFLSGVYFHAVSDTLNVLLNSRIPIDDKLAGLGDIFTSENTQRLIVWGGYTEEKKQLFKRVTDLIASNGKNLGNNAKHVADILLAMDEEILSSISQEELEHLLANVPDIVDAVVKKDYARIASNLQVWSKKHQPDFPALTRLEISLYKALDKPDHEIFKFFANINAKRPESFEQLDIGVEICNLLKKHPLLAEMNAQSAMFLRDVIVNILSEDWQAALDEVVRLSESEVPENYAEDFLVLAQNLCAATESSEAYIYFKKIWVSYLLDCSRIDEADTELEELMQLLPNDEDFIALKEGLTAMKSKSNTNRLLHREVGHYNTPTASRNGCDFGFYELVSHLKNTDLKILMVNAAKSLSSYRSKDPQYFELLRKHHRSWYGINSFKTEDQGFTRHFESLYAYLQRSTDDLIWLYETLSNYRSKIQLKTMLENWITFEPKMGEFGTDKTFAHYYDLDIMKCCTDEVFVDCGAYTGDSILSFIEQYGGQYKSIYGYELTPSTYNKAVNNLQGRDRVFMRNAGVSDKCGEMTFFDNLPNADPNQVGAANRLSDNGNAVAKLVSLDDDITENITFIKMDIEGAEIAALHGAVNHIKRSKPKLAISLYHGWSDLIEIPKLVRQFVPEYKFYFQHCPDPQFPFPQEYVLLAVIE